MIRGPAPEVLPSSPRCRIGRDRASRPDYVINGFLVETNPRVRFLEPANPLVDPMAGHTPRQKGTGQKPTKGVRT